MLRLIERANSTEVTRLTRFVQAAEQLDLHELKAEYKEVLEKAPRRHERGKRYLVGHTGIPGSGSHSNRLEEHLAIALCGAGSFELEGQTVKLIDYQVPLKSRRTDRGVGKIDLLGIAHDHDLAVIELKIEPQNGRSPETPLRALLESLAYAAIVEANAEEIASEVNKAGYTVTAGRPQVVVVAPSGYWRRVDSSAPRWRASLSRLVGPIAATISVPVRLVDLGDVPVELGLAGRPPMLLGEPLAVTLVKS